MAEPQREAPEPPRSAGAGAKGGKGSAKRGAGAAAPATLAAHLKAWAGGDDGRAAIAGAISAISEAAARVSVLIARGPLAGAMAEVVGGNVDGDAQKALDVRADEMFIEALEGGSVAVYGSEEQDRPRILNPKGPIAVAIDPLDGSSNIDTNVSVGTIFSLLPVESPPGDDPEGVFLKPGTAQLAAGFVIYGPQTALVLTLGEGTQVFTLDRDSDTFMHTGTDVQIAAGKREYAINASNYHHWDEALRAYIDDCMEGLDSPDRQQFNMRWIASLVAEAFRIFARGGIFLYPRDKRPGYQHGRLRLVYEANPISFLVEQAGGAAVDGERRIMEIVPRKFHERVPLIFGSREKVERVVRYHTDRHTIGERQPLFGRRGLFRV